MLRLQELNKSFSGFSVKNVSFEVPKGCICGLIGENGAGKSTLIKTLAGIYTKTSGQVYVDGLRFDEEEARIKDMLGLVMDEMMFEESLTAEKAEKLYGRFYSEFNRDLFYSYLDRFNISKNKKLKKFSKGMKIKFQLAFALSHNAKLFLFDEPTAGLDTEFRKEFLDICIELIADGEKTVLFSTHLTKDLDRISDYIAFMQEGELLFMSSKEALCERFSYVQAENYKLKLIPEKAVVYMQEGEYGGSALVVNSKSIKLDGAYTKRQPTVEEVMYYFVKGGKKHGRDIVEAYM